jgi:23S rRNA (adenine2503-C2)-methyltransferase
MHDSPKTTSRAENRGVNPLSLTSDQFVLSARAAWNWSADKAMDVYRTYFRTSVMPGAVPFGGADWHPAPIVRQLREDSAEGEVVKFAQRIPANPVAVNDSHDSDAERVPSGAEARLATFEHLETESVLIPMVGKSGRASYTLCVSSQVGCAMGCTFCETAQMGLIRSLRPEEIVGQWFAATHVLGRRPKNIVFMGMGEPLDNFENVVQAIAVLKDHNGAAVPLSKITVSTVGRLDGIRRLSAKLHEPGWHRLNLAISVNAPNDAIRSSIMPVNRGMPMGELRQALIDWPMYGGAKLCLEYVLIPGLNDGREHAREIAEFTRPINEHFKTVRKARTPRVVVNLIPYNPRRDSPWPAPEESRVDEFLGWLTEDGVYTKRRRTKGRQMMGACGQLGNAAIRNRRPVSITVSASGDASPA